MSKKDQGEWDLKDFEEAASKPSQWGLAAAGVYKAYPASHQKLPSGVYSISLDRRDDSPIFLNKKIKTDDILRFKDSVAWKMIEEIDTFWNNDTNFTKLKFLHRRGYLLYGKQGTGKSSIIEQVSSDIIKKGGLVFFCENPKFFNAGLSTLRKAEPERSIVCIFEDIDAIIKRYGEDELLGILDGSNMVDKVLNIATTNYPELLDKRIISRPRRFDRIIRIEEPSKYVRTEFLKKKLPKKEKVAEWVKATEGMSFAGMTEAIISVVCLGNKLDETIKILKDIENGHPSSEDFGTKGNLGFSNEVTDDETDDESFPIPGDND